MPELPEVETIRRQLAEHVGGRTITDVEVLDPLLVDPEDPRSFEHRVSGRSIEALRRTGKYLFVDLDGGEALALHLRMTGQLLWSASEPLEPTPYARAVFRIEGARAGDVLMKLSPVDQARLEPGELRRTRAAQVACALWREGDGYTLVCFRSVAGYVMGLLTHSAQPGSEIFPA